MDRHSLTAIALGVAVFASATIAGQQPAGRGGARAGGPPASPVLVFKEIWKKPYEGEPTEANRDIIRRVTPAAVTTQKLELKLYGADAKNVLVTEHEDREDLWNGMTTSPVAVTVRDRTSYFDLSGRARLRWIVRTNALHQVHPVLKLADGTLVIGDGQTTGGEFVQLEVAFNTLHWYKLDPQKVVSTTEVMNPDLSKVDEIGFADLAPGGGHNSAGWINVSHVELYARAVPR